MNHSPLPKAKAFGIPDLPVLHPLTRKTLLRRVVLALLAAFLLVWLVLGAVQFLIASNQSNTDEGIREAATGLSEALAPITSPVEARAISEATSRQINAFYRRQEVPAAMLIQLQDEQGQILFLSSNAGGIALKAELTHMTSLHIKGRLFRAFACKAGRWQIVLAGAEPGTLWLIQSLLKELLLYLGLAFPCICLPIWLAVSRGLLPLRRFSEQIAARGADNLQPVGIDPEFEELKPLASALDRLLARLRSKIEREHGFVQDAAHELRTPMAVIAAQAHVMAMADDLPKRQEAAQQLDQAIARASHLVEQLLQLARMDQEKSGQLGPLAVADTARRCLAMLAPFAMKRGQELSLEAPDQLCFPLAEPLFESILVNLLDNAIRYGAEGGCIEVELSEAGGGLQLSVADDGPGIAPADRQKVFERFYRGGGHDTQGTGLGLAIVQQAVQSSGGQVQLTSGLKGRGCRFLAEWPRPQQARK